MGRFFYPKPFIESDARLTLPQQKDTPSLMTIFRSLGRQKLRWKSLSVTIACKLKHIDLLPEKSSTERAKILVLREGEAPADLGGRGSCRSGRARLLPSRTWDTGSGHSRPALPMDIMALGDFCRRTYRLASPFTQLPRCNVRRWSLTRTRKPTNRIAGGQRRRRTD
uniref:Uncharacterized protein n=1 Tax=Candidatus Kentrum sp. FM TaxID=2126340 RepID=A0A450SY33_9GAMM|nr:MAG: hypothetical protein BECKFM1743C_GA0114222_101714 [Candidatus Kentron sp. FM]VFJ59021.1 MAG: hypothetical protein BECKFM1743A_GA0114220_102295 [Candidatus Kentron sp. FM]VFK11936.1 MAG: hypothetical protein BECKFM1743B_GA0114221_102162 [Candidatus Kentron sp. FM]